jgi:hypothetical protein
MVPSLKNGEGGNKRTHIDCFCDCSENQVCIVAEEALYVVGKGETMLLLHNPYLLLIIQFSNKILTCDFNDVTPLQFLKTCSV